MGFAFIKNKEEDGGNERQILIIAFILSVLFHLFLLWLLNQENLFSTKRLELKKSPPQELVITFPENKPQPKQKEWKIVQNMNENEERPEDTDLLADRNSRAKNPVKSKLTGNTPLSQGNTDIQDFSPTPRFKEFANYQTKTFSKKALIGETSANELMQQNRENTAKAFPQNQASQGANQIYNQKKFSVEDLGALSLSTYKWEWAPYVNALKNKLYQVWFTPPAYHRLGIIHGYTVVRFTISRKGKLTNLEVLKQVGHHSLELSSTEAIKALFPFLPLPEDFPEKELTITAKLIYPDLRRGR